MIKLFKKINLFFVMTLAFVLFALPALAQTKKAVNDLATKIGFKKNTEDVTFYTMIGDLIKPVLELLGVIMLVLLIYAGALWMTARGESGQVDKAKSIIKSVIIGAIIVFGAYTITLAVLGIFGVKS